MLARGLSCSPAHGMSRQKAVCSPVAAPRSVTIHRVIAPPRVRIVCWSTHYANTILPDGSVVDQNVKFNVGHYDTELDEENRTVDKITKNKQKLNAAFKVYEDRVGSGVGDSQSWAARKALMLAMAMQETNHIDVRQRDAKKDNDPKSANCSIFNLSVDFIEKTGYYAGGPGHYQPLTPEQQNRLNSDAGLPEAVGILECGFAQWGIENTLAFVRQGGSGFNPDNFRSWGQSWRALCHFDGVAGLDEKAMLSLKAVAPITFYVCEYLQCIKRSLRYIDDNPAVFENDERPDIQCTYI